MQEKSLKKYYNFLHNKVHIIKSSNYCDSNFFSFVALFKNRDLVQKYLSKNESKLKLIINILYHHKKLFMKIIIAKV